MQGAWAENSAALAPKIAQALRGGDCVMVKGSLGSRMALIVDALSALGDSDAPAENSALNDTNGKTARAVQQG
jgi:UDP-N-acetylmuramoyl-tripeptide--D-alanyl-D-alanine ligase